ncbi:hypothetical protein AMTRI_Chr05g71750 [Amborella trichopoda]|uniref:Vesicle transport protein n=1 Tax=Amborella trichopoda TaxID=13333 RepID=W1NK10_AMBTC|nr:uncharacterized protein LOC110008369 [Amborella trichopoda]XP_020530932.1 uncharacterized protein LOC110008369 [Amborella trichopoda]ERM95786.1 hypothetical protein AMTR_s00188p00016770 [Amborella trichopoda]|eukprot:XP_020530922.1 uncharacterized protein LOC110008369 [Amborella trichopoda]
MGNIVRTLKTRFDTTSLSSSERRTSSSSLQPVDHTIGEINESLGTSSQQLVGQTIVEINESFGTDSTLPFTPSLSLSSSTSENRTSISSQLDCTIIINRVETLKRWFGDSWTFVRSLFAFLSLTAEVNIDDMEELKREFETAKTFLIGLFTGSFAFSGLSWQIENQYAKAVFLLSNFGCILYSGAAMCMIIRGPYNRRTILLVKRKICIGMAILIGAYLVFVPSLLPAKWMVPAVVAVLIINAVFSWLGY